MLSVARKHRIDAADSGLDSIRRKYAVTITPRAFDKFSVIFGQFALGSQNIHLIDFFFIKTIQEILGERFGIGQALHAAVHETGIS